MSSNPDDYEEEPVKKKFKIFGIDYSRDPCAKPSFMYGIASGAFVGVAYNFGTSRNPFNLALGVHGIVMFGFWFVCKYKEREMDKKLELLKPVVCFNLVLYLKFDC